MPTDDVKLAGIRVEFGEFRLPNNTTDVGIKAHVEVGGISGEVFLSTGGKFDIGGSLDQYVLATPPGLSLAAANAVHPDGTQTNTRQFTVPPQRGDLLTGVQWTTTAANLMLTDPTGRQITASTRIAKGRYGSPYSASRKRISALSTCPPKNPAVAP